ncbi:tyrosine-type recombinase/integrase [Microvirga aerilata]|uniref:Tyrosine-type recombinase/integrase n=1 Tax=Microvirga aerilata TaxID=670292 RepID=A0A937CYU4_9HYPH|nr:site-specific integrase [Microvirga aerilata]MBL0403831.1 tyrosine-type recombinase/integrase [Microvirga aerilata]
MTDLTTAPDHLPSPDLLELEQAASEIASQARSANTVRAYQNDWSHFSCWCSDKGLQALPALPRTITIYMTAHKDRYSMATLNRRLSSIAAAHRMADHPFDTRCREIALVMDGLRRTKTVRQRQVTALTTPLLKRALDGISGTLADRRNRSLTLLGMAGALRRSEIVALNVSDLTFSPEGVRLLIRHSKGDQFGEGQVIAIARTNSDLCPVSNLEAYLRQATITEGRVFRAIDRHGNLKTSMTDQSVALIVKKLCGEARLEGDYSGHSLRAGFATQAAKSGVEERKIASTTRHKNMEVLRRYIREGSLFANAVTADLDL